MSLYGQAFWSLPWQERSEILRNDLGSKSGDSPVAHPGGLISPHSLVFEYGLEFEPRPMSNVYAGLQEYACFNNAWQLVKLHPGYQYVEGYAVPSDLGAVLHHAWCVDNNGRLVDPTWRNPQGCTYLGIGFKRNLLKALVEKYNANPTFLDFEEESYPLLRGAVSIHEIAIPELYRKTISS